MPIIKALLEHWSLEPTSDQLVAWYLKYQPPTKRKNVDANTVNPFPCPIDQIQNLMRPPARG